MRIPRVTMPPMRRLARHVFTLLAALSLLLCVAACVLWVRSYSQFDSVHYFSAADSQNAQTWFAAQSRWGETAFYRTRSRPSPSADLVGSEQGQCRHRSS